LLGKKDGIAENYFREEHLAVALCDECVARAVACVLGKVNSAAPLRTFPSEPHVEPFLTLDDHFWISFRGSMPKQCRQRIPTKLLRELLTLHLVTTPEVDVLDNLNLKDFAMRNRQPEVVLDLFIRRIKWIKRVDIQVLRVQELSDRRDPAFWEL